MQDLTGPFIVFAMEVVFLGVGLFALVLFFKIFGQIAQSLNEISVVLQEMLKDSRSGK